MRLRLTPRETGFYELLSRSAANLVTGTNLLAELLSVAPSGRGDVGGMRCLRLRIWHRRASLPSGEVEGARSVGLAGADVEAGAVRCCA